MWNFIRKLYKHKLDIISPSLCLAKWTQSNIYLSSGMTHSCHHPAPHIIPIVEIKKNPHALHNTDYKKEQRNLMLQGIRPKECDYCWKIEDQGNISDRITKSYNDWSRPFLKNILEHGASLDIPKYVEVSFDNTCNLKCSYCGPNFSSKWVEELDRLGEWPKEINYYNRANLIPNNEENPYIDAFWKWFPEIYFKLHTFRITGGEPLLSKNTFKVLDYLIANPNKKLNLSINTNLSVPDKNFNLFIEKIKKIRVRSLTIHTSCDAYKEAAEYARHGLNYDEWLKNCNRIIKEIPTAKLDIMITYNIFSVTTFMNFLQDIKKLKDKQWFRPQRVSVSIGYLRNPEHLSLWVLPNEFSKIMIDQVNFMKINKFKKTEINQMERLVPLIYRDDSIKIPLKKKFKMFVQEHDRRRSTDFLLSNPLLQKFYETCK